MQDIIIVEEQDLIDIADSIRKKTGSTKLMGLLEMPIQIMEFGESFKDCEQAQFGANAEAEGNYSISSDRLNEIAVEAQRFARTSEALNPAQILQSLKDAVDDNPFIEGCVPEVHSETVTKIKPYCFYYDETLAKFDCTKVASIGAGSFNSCSNLTALILRSETMCSLGNTNAFTNSSIALGTGYVYVPRALVDTYKANTNWKTYANQIRAIEDYPDVCEGKEVIREYVFDVSKEASYTFDKRYVDYDDGYSLITEYEYELVEESIDSGKMMSISVDNNFTNIESLEVE